MILSRLSGLDEVRQGGLFKYVRLPDGSFRFADVCSFPEHRFMIDQSETAVSAGTVRVSLDEDRDVRMEGYGSITLGIKRPLDDDLEKILCLLWDSPTP